MGDFCEYLVAFICPESGIVLGYMAWRLFVSRTIPLAGIHLISSVSMSGFYHYDVNNCICKVQLIDTFQSILILCGFKPPVPTQPP